MTDKKQNHKYFAAIAEQMENGGCEALLYYLLLRDLSKFNVRQAPPPRPQLSQIRKSVRAAASTA